MSLTTKSILKVLSEDWQPLVNLIFKLKLTNTYDARFLLIKLKEFERKGYILVDEKMGKKHWKLKIQSLFEENLKVEAYFDPNKREFINHVKLGVLGQYTNSWSTNELFLPLDTSYLRDELFKNMFNDIQPVIGFNLSFSNNLVSIRDSGLFHRAQRKLPYCWDITKKIAVEAEVFDPIIEKLSHVPNYTIDRYRINPSRYGTLERKALFSYGEYELVLPLELSFMKDDLTHQSIKELLREINPLAGFVFSSDKMKNLLILFDDALFGDWYDEWDLRTQTFVKEIFPLTDFEGEKSLDNLTSGYLVFISYSTLDSKEFNVPYISRELAKFPEIDKVLFWEKDMDDNIIEYMNRYVKECDLFVLICTQNATDSEWATLEWQVALKMGKKIIPIFKDQNNIPPLLSPRLGIEFDENNLEETINKLYNLILTKCKKKEE